MYTYNCPREVMTVQHHNGRKNAKAAISTIFALIVLFTLGETVVRRSRQPVHHNTKIISLGPKKLPQNNQSSFADQFSLALQSDEITPHPGYGYVVPFIIRRGKLFCRRSHKHQIQQAKGALGTRSRSFIEMVASLLHSHRHRKFLTRGIRRGRKVTSGGLPILLFAGDHSGCDITKRSDKFDFPRLSWSIPSPMKYGAEWCNAIPMPTYAFWDLMSHNSWKKIHASQSDKYQWSSKINKAVWRGSTTYDKVYTGAELSSTPRGKLVQKSIGNPELIDAGFTKFIQQYASREDELSNHTILTEHMEFSNQMNYKAILDIDGNSWSSRFPKLLCTNSVVIKVEANYVEHFYNELTPMRHYVPASIENITQVVAYVIDGDNEEEMKSIVHSANSWCRRKMTKGELLEDALQQLKTYEESMSESIQNESIRIAEDFEPCYDIEVDG